MIIRTILSFLFLAVSLPCYAVELVSHRGNACGTMENSVEAVKSAWTAGSNAVEVDVRVSGDGIVFLYHDAEIKNQRLVDLDYSEVVNLVGKSAVPTLKSVLMINGSTGYYILDLKQVGEGDYQSIIKAVRGINISQAKLVFQSDNEMILAEIRKALPHSRYFYLNKLKRRLPFFTVPKPESLIKKITNYGFDAISVKGRRFIDSKFIETLKSGGLKVYVWTINDVSRAHYYKSIGVDGIITDNVEGLRFLLADKTQPGFGCQELVGIPTHHDIGNYAATMIPYSIDAYNDIR